ncbi:MAG TPA: hypothetical protein VFN09_07295, partial [Rhodanobacteraceae bacterium]|nr:hypothetical protein [Rhodanobacteraceae bacterium]
SGNRAVLGGGLFVGTGTGYVKQVDLDGVTFANNTATHSGGGLYADQADVHITGEKASSFTGNSAMGTTDDNGGGALYAMNSNVHITAAMNPTVAFMDGNWASASGGAIFLRAAVGKSAWFSLIAPQGSGAPVITSNSATYLGGAIYVNAIGDGSTAQVVLFDTIIANNLAPQASAVQLYAGGNTQTRATLNMYANPFSSPCNVIQRCNRISGNQSGDYGTVVAETSGQARTVFQMDQGHLVNNITVNFGGLVDNIGPGNDTWINNSVIADNDFGNAPLATASGQFQINNTTIARNNRVSPAVIRSYGAPITFHNNLVFQPEAPLLASSGGADVNLCNLMVGNLTGLDNLVARNIQYTTDPVFVNAGQGDYRIQVGSQARNRYASTGCASVAHEDLLGATRPDRPDLPTPYDMGAYEYGAVVDHLFNDSFDGEVASRPASP